MEVGFGVPLQMLTRLKIRLCEPFQGRSNLDLFFLAGDCFGVETPRKDSVFNCFQAREQLHVFFLTELLLCYIVPCSGISRSFSRKEVYMYERFTDRARKVMRLANEEAQRFNHEYIGTEHILLGLVKEGSGVAAQVLGSLGVDLHMIRLEVEKLVESGSEMVTMGRLPQTPRAKKAIEYSMEEVRNLNHKYVGTEHILLGLIREQEGVAAQVLMNLRLNVQDVRDEVLRFLMQGDMKDSNEASSKTDTFVQKPVAVKTDKDITVDTAEPALDTDQVLKGLLVSAGQLPERLPDLLKILSEEGLTRTVIVNALRFHFAMEKGEAHEVVDEQ